MTRNSTDRQGDEGQAQDEDLAGMAVEVSSNQVRNEAIPASHHEEKGQESVVQNEKHSHRSAHHQQAAGHDQDQAVSRDGQHSGD